MYIYVDRMVFRSEIKLHIHMYTRAYIGVKHPHISVLFMPMFTFGLEKPMVDWPGERVNVIFLYM